MGGTHSDVHTCVRTRVDTSELSESYQPQVAKEVEEIATLLSQYQTSIQFFVAVTSCVSTVLAHMICSGS